ncbi:SDR family oxidoreductase [Novosphingobium bradum]|uniref:SDR family oxidoreductase n=1 Tax=Novosphingobium bradum TaxID=1737444 RepID=A0ABV7IJ45_9SPHN
MTGKIVVITGAGGGLGRALSRRLASDGDTVVMLGRTLSKLEEVATGIGERAVPIACEITSPDSVRAAFAQIAETFGQIDALINNAGLFQPSTLLEASDELITDAVMTNLAGTAFCARAAIPLLKRGGHIINVTSESVAIPLPFLTIYQASKAGVENFTQMLNLELYDRGIRVSTVRAGTMVGEGMSAKIEPETMMRMFADAGKRGIDMMARGASSYESTVDAFRLILNSPADLYVPSVAFHGLPAGWTDAG